MKKHKNKNIASKAKSKKPVLLNTECSLNNEPLKNEPRFKVGDYVHKIDSGFKGFKIVSIIPQFVFMGYAYEYSIVDQDSEFCWKEGTLVVEKIRVKEWEIFSKKECASDAPRDRLIEELLSNHTKQLSELKRRLDQFKGVLILVGSIAITSLIIKFFS